MERAQFRTHEPLKYNSRKGEVSDPTRGLSDIGKFTYLYDGLLTSDLEHLTLPGLSVAKLHVDDLGVPEQKWSKRSKCERSFLDVTAECQVVQDEEEIGRLTWGI